MKVRMLNTRRAFYLFCPVYLVECSDGTELIIPMRNWMNPILSLAFKAAPFFMKVFRKDPAMYWSSRPLYASARG